MHRLVLSVALLWSTPALAYPYLISEQEAGSLTEVTGAACNPDPTPRPCQLPYNPVRIRVSDTEYCVFSDMCSAESAGFDEATLEINTCEADNVTLTIDLDACEADVDDCSVTLTTQEGEIATLTVDLNDCQGDLAGAQASLTVKDGQIATLEVEVSTLETENATLESENDSLQTENDSLQTEKASLEARIADLEDQIEEPEVGECGCATPGFSGAPGAALLVALGLVRRRRAA